MRSMLYMLLLMGQKFKGKAITKNWTMLLTVLTLCFQAPSLCLAEEDLLDLDFFEMSLEDLGEIQISLASKKEENLFDVPAAAYVITSEDIKRSGATTIPEILRGVPGITVARINSNSWVITSRDYLSEYANKLLILIDNRSIYSPLFGGTFWDMQHLMLEDVERIEIIRGPGGALWGANAVNGIINIITKKASDTQGGLASAIVGTEVRSQANLRYGGQLINDKTHYRVFGRYYNQDAGYNSSDSSKVDDWDVLQSGLRIDSQLNETESLTIDYGIYDGQIGSFIPRYEESAPFPVLVSEAENVNVRGTHILGRWTKQIDSESEATFQTYYDRAERHQEVLDYTTNTIDLDFQYRFMLNDNHELTWGVGYRHINDQGDGGLDLVFERERSTTNLYSGFIQDRIALSPEFSLTLGTKFEHFTYTGFNYQPSAKITWKPDNNKMLWASISRAVHTPNRVGYDINTTISYTGPFKTYFKSNKDLENESLIAYETGYRQKLSDDTTIDLALFFNDYSNMPSAVMGMDPGNTAMYLQSEVNSNSESYGFETTLEHRINNKWTVNANYSFIRMFYDVGSSTIANYEEQFKDEPPRNQASIRSHMKLSDKLELDVMGYYVDNISKYNIHGYFDMDVRLGWKIDKDTDFEIVGHNLLDSHRQEYIGFKSAQTDVQRGLFARFTRKF